jgi:hypothetical protein
MVKAVATVRFEGNGRPSIPGHPEQMEMRVPEAFVLKAVLCYAFKPGVSAGCAQFSNSGKEVPVLTSAGRYPPLYYAFVGVPSLFGHSQRWMYAMRLMSSLLSAVFVAIAFASALRYRRRLMAAAIAVAATPMLFGLSGAINPSGFEIAAALATWCSWAILLSEPAKNLGRDLYLATGVATLGLSFARPLSPLWVVVIIGILGVFNLGTVKERWQEASFTKLLTVIGAGLVISTGYVIWARSLISLPIPGLPPGYNLTHRFTNALELAGGPYGYFQQIVGMTGWIDTPTPLLTTTLWMLVFGGLLTLAVIGLKRAGQLALGVTVAISLLVPLIWAMRYGVFWQERYGLPVLVGIPVICSLAELQLERINLRRFIRFVAAATAIGQLGALYWAVRRYVVGLGPEVNPLRHPPGAWLPPVNLYVLGVTALVVTAGWVIVFGVLPWRMGPELGDHAGHLEGDDLVVTIGDGVPSSPE